MRLSVWSDDVCLFCHLVPVLDRLRAELGEAALIDWRAFELRPAPVSTLAPDGAYPHRVWGDAGDPVAGERGMTLRLPPAQPRSRLALETAEFARSTGLFDAVHRAPFKAFLEDGRDLDDLGVLVEAGASAGLDGAALRDALREGRHTAKVPADGEPGRELGIGSVPAMVVAAGERALLVGDAQPYEGVRRAVEQAMANA